MTAAELRLKTTEDLQILQAELRENLFRLRMQHYTGQLDKPSRLKGLRRDIARVQTLLTERGITE